MAYAEFKEAPPLHGWAIAVAAGALMFGASFVAMGIGAIGSVGIGAVVALIVGVIFTLAEAGSKAAPAAKTASPAVPIAAATVPVSTPVSTPVPMPDRAPQAEAVVATSALVSAAPEATPAAEPSKPEGLAAPVGTADDLKRINGVGPVLEGKLNALGFYHFWQIAAWTRPEVEWVDSYLSFKGRIDRDNWIAQATTLAQTSPSKPA